MGRRKHASFGEIAEAQRELLDRLAPRVPFGAETTTCWACGFSCGKSCLERAHVGASSVMPDDRPENLWLLCERCHRDQPDGASFAVQFRWLKTREPFRTLVEKDVEPLLVALRESESDSEILRFLAWTREDPRYEALLLATTRPARTGLAAAYTNFLWGILQMFWVWKALDLGGEETLESANCHSKIADLAENWWKQGYEALAVSQRLKRGLSVAQRNGVRLGRPRRLVDLAALKDLKQAGLSWRTIAEEMRIPRRTLQRAARSLETT